MTMGTGTSRNGGPFLVYINILDNIDKKFRNRGNKMNLITALVNRYIT